MQDQKNNATASRATFSVLFIYSDDGESHFICNKPTRASGPTSLARNEQAPPLLTSGAPLQFCLPSVHDIVSPPETRVNEEVRVFFFFEARVQS